MPPARVAAWAAAEGVESPLGSGENGRECLEKALLSHVRLHVYAG